MWPKSIAGPLNDIICHQGGSMESICNFGCGLMIDWWSDEVFIS